jgi:hypothetical protein
MRETLITLLFASGVFAQVATSPQNPPAAPVSPQIPPGPPVIGRPTIGMPQQARPAGPPVSPDTVVATIDGKPWTAAQMDELLSELPVKTQGIVQQQPVTFIQQFLNFKALEKKAEDDGLDKKAPYEQELFYNRMVVLTNAEFEKARNAIVIPRQDEEKYYETNKDALYRVVKTKVIYVGFAPPPPAVKPGAAAPPVPAVKPPVPPAGPNGVARTETEAKAKIEDLRKQLLAGADFGKLAKENSDDKISAAKDGDYGDIMRSSPYPAQIKDAIFKLKAGEVSEPIAQPSGYYLIKAVDVSYRPFAAVEEEIRTQLTNEQFKTWRTDLDTHNKVTVEVPSYFSTRQPK